VGRSYPPEFYSWIQNSRVRNLFEKIAVETEEDYQTIIKKLGEFGVQIMRPDLPLSTFDEGRYILPPMTPRDHMVMVGDTFYASYYFDFKKFYQDVRDKLWPDCADMEEFATLPVYIQKECKDVHKLDQLISSTAAYDPIYQHIRQQGNKVKFGVHFASGANVARIGRDLFFGTEAYDQDIGTLRKEIDLEFLHTRNHVVNTGGHSDGTYCPVCPGLIISLHDVPTYADTFPGWEVVYLPGQSWEAVAPFLALKEKNRGRWWIPGFEYDNDVIEVVETWLDHWVGYVEETVFDVNMLIIDPKNVMVFNENDQVFEALHRYGITPHVVPFRHRYFWDGGIHCVTLDLDRTGHMQDFFPNRPKKV
jgi:hypothetical protein